MSMNDENSPEATNESKLLLSRQNAEEEEDDVDVAMETQTFTMATANDDLTMNDTVTPDSGGDKADTMMTDDVIEDRIHDMTRSLLALDALGAGTDMTPDKRAFSRYHGALKGIIPIRFEKARKQELPISQAGLFSRMTFGWQTRMMWNIYRKGIDSISDLHVGLTEQAKPNADRLERHWNEELQQKGAEKASFSLAVFKSVRSRFIFIVIVLLLTTLLQFSIPAFILHKLLSHLNSGNVHLEVGIGLVLGISATELGRSFMFALAWFLNYTSGVRLRAATQSLLFRKILRLRNLKDKSVGELVNLLSNDGQRIFEAIALGPHVFPGPIVMVIGLIYILVLIGPWGFIAMGTFISFYPFMVLVAKATNYFRRKCIVITDKRVRMMNELLTSIKLIKMYAWEKSFAKTIAGIRSSERKVLEKAAYVQSVSTSTSALVPVMASVFTFLAMVLSGVELTAVEAFTIIAVLNSLRFSLSVLPFVVKALADAKVSFQRYKDILLMEEMISYNWQIFNDKYAIVLNKATFRWDTGQENDSTGNTQDKDGAKEKTPPNNHDNDDEKQKLQNAEHIDGSITMIVEDIPPTLTDITFMTEKGKLVGICGTVGCGKSSLLSAILGRMMHVSGKIALEGQLAYVSQQAWIMNMTVRDNILFGAEYDETRYSQVVEACALTDDFKDFVDGDQTEIGERGINLSGGQKQRVSLARAVYSNNDVYLLDDPLSAVDIHVGRHIFHECILKQLKGKTVLFVTHQLQYLSDCDSVMFMKEGAITEVGSHDQLMAGDTEYAGLIRVFYTQGHSGAGSPGSEPGRPMSMHRQISERPPSALSSNSWGDSPGSPTTPPPHRRMDPIRQLSMMSDSGSDGATPTHRPPHLRDPLRQMSVMSQRTMSVEEDTNQGKLIVAEERVEGKVSWAVYRYYIRALGGYLVSALVAFMFVLAVASLTFTNWWLSHWFNQCSGNQSHTYGNVTFYSVGIASHPALQFYSTIYGASVFVMVSLTVLRCFVFMKATLRASSKMHNNIFQKILASPMKFFDTTPVGRIINRFSSDLDEIDVRLPSTSEMFLQNVLLILFSLCVIAYVSPWFLIALVPLALGFVLLNVVFTSGVRELKRMDAITKSPLLSHVTASVQGISTIHAFGKTEEFLKKFDELMDQNSSYFYLFYCANRWLAVRLDYISLAIMTTTGLCIVLTYDTLTPAMAGLAFSFAIQMTGLFQFTVRLAIETETKFVAVQRLQFYSQDSETEAPAVIKDQRPPAEWPSQGEIKYVQYKMTYRDNLPLALKGVGFTVKAREKIGIVGRSGSGKSSLGVALFRLVEPASGTIIIDGVDITKIGLEDLRSRLAIIPQDPVLFVGTVRYNLDPFNQHTDNELWSALEQCHVKDTISSLEKQLNHQVIENGENFSVGERQLLCMARALLRHSKILMLDEATAAIDTETDAMVQTTIKEAFADCTMLIIAHRLNTVLNCSRILVMEDGKVVEYGRPSDLLASSTSKFKAMLDAVEKQQESSP